MCVLVSDLLRAVDSCSSGQPWDLRLQNKLLQNEYMCTDQKTYLFF